MKIFFIGTVKFSEYALLKLISLNTEIVGVITKDESKFNADYANLQVIAEKYNIPCFITKDANSLDSVKFIKSTYPDVIYCFGWSNLIKSEVLTIPPRGVVGFHPAWLPSNRGRHPIIWALVLGLKKTASTFFMMDDGADSGDILSQVSVSIEYEDDAFSLYNKITKVALEQIEIFTYKLQYNEEKLTRQDDLKATYWRKRNKSDGVIDFRMSSQAIYNLVRALSKPYIGASIYYMEEEVKIWKVSEVQYSFENIEPGKVLQVNDDGSFLIKCYGGAVLIQDHGFSSLPKVGEYL